MESALRAQVHDLTLAARHLLVIEAGELLEGVYGLHRDGRFEPADRLPALKQLSDAVNTRARLERLLADEKTAGLSPREAVAKLTKEVAYSWLNRVAAFKMLETRKLIRSSVSKGMQSGGFLMWLAEPGNEAELARYDTGSLPLDALGEGPRDTAYRHYLLHLCAYMSGQIRVLFEADNLPSRLCPRPRALADLLALLNAPGAALAWEDDETIGWIYQYFNEQEKAEIFARLNKGAKITASEIPAATELFTPRWIVRALVENSLGRLWLQMHPDSRLREALAYLIPDVDAAAIAPKPVREITLLDPACGTMHFGLVAFDLFAAMYREELERAGEPGWPAEPSVRTERAIAAAIVEHNLFGIDIDLRAVQLSALTLYLKAKALNKAATISESNLACADILMLNRDRLESFLEVMPFPRLTHERIVRGLWEQLRNASPSQMGSLLRLEERATQLLLQEQGFYQRPGQNPLPYEELRQLNDPRAVADVLKALRDYLWQQMKLGKDESYFVGEMQKGTRMLSIVLGRYDVVASNPPYMTSRNMSLTTINFLKREYPASKSDLYAAFIDRGSEMLAPGGRLAMITQQSFMFISSYEDLRAKLRGMTAIETMIHVGPRAFAEIGGEKVNTTLFVLRAEPDAERRDSSVGTYIRLVREPDAGAKRRGFEHALAALPATSPRPQSARHPRPQSAQVDFVAARLRGAVSTAGRTARPAVYRYRQGDFDAIPGSPWVYWITPGLRRLFQTLPKLGEIAQPRQGLATADNFRFLRYWWEVGTARIGFGCKADQEAQVTVRRWFPYMKGGEFQRWWGNQQHSVNWANEGDEIKNYICEAYPYLKGKWQWVAKNTDYYFRRGVTWTDLTSGSFSARLSPGGFIFDVSGSSAFPPDTDLVLGIMNSTFAQAALKMINPTVHVQVGDLARLPIPDHHSDTLRDLVSRAIALARVDSAEDETTYEFIAPPAWHDGMARVAARHAALAAVERAIDEEVYRLYGIGPEDRAAIEAELAAPAEGEVTTEETEGTEDREERELKSPAGGWEMADPTEVETAVSGGPAGQPALTGKGRTPYAPTRAGNGETERAELARRWVSYAVGIVLGRFEPGVPSALGSGVVAPEAGVYAEMEVPGPQMLALAEGGIAPEVGAGLRALSVPHGISPVEAGHPSSLAESVTRALDLLVGEDQTERLIAAATSGRPLAEWLARDFFKEHVKLYRKRPIYWLFQSPKRAYSAYLFSERVTPDTLHLLRGSAYLGGRITRVREELTGLRGRIAGMSRGAERRRAEKSGDALEADLADLEAFDKQIAAVTMRPNSRSETAGWAPDLDDGILINLAPLYTLLPAWSAEPRQCLEALERGEYDWSHTAMRYWPDRVLAKCRETKSYAIAHCITSEVEASVFST